MTAKHISGEITLTLEGVVYVLRPSYQAIIAIEDATGESIVQLANRATQFELTLKDAGIIATEMLRAWGREADAASDANQRAAAQFGTEGVSKLLYELGMPAVNGRLGLVLVNAATGGVTAEGKAKPATE